MTLWTICWSPLMFGGDRQTSDAFTIDLLTNAEVMQVHQGSRDNHPQDRLPVPLAPHGCQYYRLRPVQRWATQANEVCDLIDVVSKNCALLLNVGPKPDGTIPEGDARILRAIGRWLSVNGKAIYDTRPWTIPGEGPTEVAEGSFTDTKRTSFTGQDFRFTRNGDVLYAIALAWPGEEAVIASLRQGSDLLTSRIEQVSMLGAGPLEWSQDSAGLRVRTPAQKPCEDAFTFRIQLSHETPHPSVPSP